MKTIKQLTTAITCSCLLFTFQADAAITSFEITDGGNIGGALIYTDGVGDTNLPMALPTTANIGSSFVSYKNRSSLGVKWVNSGHSLTATIHMTSTNAADTVWIDYDFIFSLDSDTKITKNAQDWSDSDVQRNNGLGFFYAREIRLIG